MNIKKSVVINFASVFVIMISIAIWFFLFMSFSKKGGEIKDRIGLGSSKGRIDKSEGVGSEVNEDGFGVGKLKKESSEESGKRNLNFAELLSLKPGAPARKEGYGDTYVRAHAAVAIDADTGTILHYQNGKKKMAIASLTKVMTAIIAVENIKNLKSEIITIDKEAYDADGTRVGCPNSISCVSDRLVIGEKVRAIHLLEAMLVNSANDAAIAIGKHIAGSQVKFAEMMNSKARELGLMDTNFCNPSGLDDDDNPGACYSTAYDFARISAYSMKHQLIWDIMKIKEKSFKSADGRRRHRIVSTDKLLDQLSNCLGGKTGFTFEAGKSLMMAAHHPNKKQHKVIAVLLNDEERWVDMKKLLAWSFGAYNWVK